VGIISDKGRPRSIRDLAEEHDRLREEIEGMTLEEQIAVIETLEKIGGEIPEELLHVSKLAAVDYRVRPVSVDRFLHDEYYIGHIGRTLYPQLKKDLEELFEGDYHEGALGGSIGWGKTYFATCAMAYVLYQMSCLRHPQRAYGLSDGSAIYVAMLAPSEKVARRVAVQELMGKIEHSPYFREHFKHLRYAPSSLEIEFPNKIWVVAGSTRSTAIIGLNVFSGFIDETSFMGESKSLDSSGKFIVEDLGEKIHKSIVRRIKSRFQQVGRLPGVLLTVSSKERPTAFIEKRIEQAKENEDPSFFVREYATWDVKPGNYSGKRFWVVAGNEKIQSRILKDDENLEREKARWTEMGLRVIDVPIEWKNDFERDIDNALREIAGIATEAVTRFMTRIDMITKAVDLGSDVLTNPVGDEGTGAMHTWMAGTPLVIRWGSIAETFERRLAGGVMEQAWRPRRHPHALRYVHWDSSLTGDCTGLAIAHVARWKEVIRRDPFGEEYTELAPVIETDLVLRIKPPPGDEIMMSDVRSILYQFVGHGFQIAYVSMDQYQSADSLQQLKKRGIEAEVVSVDKTSDAYDTLKDAIYEGRAVVHPHPWLESELRSIQRIMKSGGRVKIDHPDRMTGPDGNEVVGSKDVADALAGVTFSLTRRMPGRPVPPVRGASITDGQEKPDHSWVSGGRVMVSEKSGTTGDRRSIVGGTPSFEPDDGPKPFIKG
jgi:hypothetical protein